MRGAHGTAQAICDGIVAGVVAQLEQIEDEHGPLPDGVIAEPALITPEPLPPETVGFDAWPFVTVTPARSPRYVRTDIGADVDTYLVVYDMRALVWARGPGYGETALARDRATQAVVQVFLAGEGAFAGGDLVVDRETISVDWSPTGMDVELEAIVAAASISFSVGSQELFTRPIPGLSAAEGGWTPEVDVTGWGGDTQGIAGGPPPPGTV